MLKQMLTVRGKYLGAGEYKKPLTDIGKSIRNLAYYCPECGEIWARVNYIDTEKPESTFLYTAHNLPCGCRAGCAASTISGYPYKRAYDAALPRTRDFILYELNQYAKDPEMYWFDGYNRSAS